MLGAYCVVVGECRSAVDERLLGGPLDAKILLHFSSRLLSEAESEVNAGATLIRVAYVTSSPRTHSAFEDAGPNDRHRLPVHGQDVAPHGRGLADVGGDIMIEQKIADMRKVVFCRFKRFPRRRSQADGTESPIDGLHLA